MVENWHKYWQQGQQEPLTKVLRSEKTFCDIIPKDSRRDGRANFLEIPSKECKWSWLWGPISILVRGGGPEILKSQRGNFWVFDFQAKKLRVKKSVRHTHAHRVLFNLLDIFRLYLPSLIFMKGQSQVSSPVITHHHDLISPCSEIQNNPSCERFGKYEFFVSSPQSGLISDLR